MKRTELAVAFMMSPLFLAQASLSLSMMQAGSFLDFLRPVMPFLSEIVGFFGNMLIPLGQYFGTLLEGPLTTLSTSIPARSVTGYALYFIVFAGIFIVALYLNVMWRPLGYATADSRAKREEKAARWAEKEAAKEEAKAKRKGLKGTPPTEKPTSEEHSVEKPAASESPQPSIVDGKEAERDTSIDKGYDDDTIGEYVDEGKGPE